jgi:hypothetical protein
LPASPQIASTVNKVSSLRDFTPGYSNLHIAGDMKSDAFALISLLYSS